MIIQILKPVKKWKAGDIADVTSNFGNELIRAGLAEKAGDQTRRDYQPKVEEEKQSMTVNNYYVLAENEILQIEDDEHAAYTSPESNASPESNDKPESKPKPKRKFFNLK